MRPARGRTGVQLRGPCSTRDHERLRARALALLFACALASLGTSSLAQGEQRGPLVVHGTMDRPAFEPIAAAFVAVHPEITVHYEELNSIELHRRFLDHASRSVPTADVVMSSAIDLQMKLVNDGHALAHRSPHAATLPQWAIWRDEAFAYAYEPVVMVYNATLLAREQRPTSRYRLVEILRADPERFLGRVGTYDPQRSGTGYLYATQDMEHSPIVWELMRTFGEVNVRLYTASRPIIDAVAAGELLIGYNVVGSYAHARAATDPAIAVVAPEDYMLVVSRTAFISRHGRHPARARRFLDYLLSRDGQRIVGGPSGLFPVRADTGLEPMRELRLQSTGGIRPVRLSPGLLVYVDRLKRDKVLRRWRAAILEGAPMP